MDETREKKAIRAYLKLIEDKGASSALLYRRASFLDKLSLVVATKPANGSVYRIAVEMLMESVLANDWHENLTTAREFYPFWIGDIKAIAAIHVNPGFDVNPLTWTPEPISLKALTDSIETEKFETSENWPLKAYAQALRNEGAEQSLVDTRVKVAKVILKRLRGSPEKNHKTYRKVVDLTLPLFHIKQTRRLFLVVVREFYHFWSGNPDAADMVLKDDSGNILL